MKQHIGPIYLILGCMAVAALTIGAKPMHHHEGKSEKAAAVTSVRALPASPAALESRLVVVVTPEG